MNGHRFSLLLGALVLAAVQPQVAQAQYCMITSSGHAFDLTADEPTDIFFGTVDISSDTDNWQATGARGTVNREIRHHTFTAINPDLDDDPGCDDGTGLVDWFTYNGRIAVAGGGSFSYNAQFLNSCGFSGSITATISPGACRLHGSPQPPSGGSPETRATPQSQTDVRVSPEGYGVVSRPNPFSDGATITYAVPAPTDVRLAVYDALGREVALLVDGAVEAGAHSVAFDASALPAGTYLYRMTAGTHVESGHMAVVR